MNLAISPHTSKAKINATKMKASSPRLKPNTPLIKTEFISVKKFSNMII